MNTLPIVMTAGQLIELLGQDGSEVYRALQAGKIPGAFKAGKRWYIGRDRFLKAITTGAVKP